jgi:hypothetical protein
MLVMPEGMNIEVEALGLSGGSGVARLTCPRFCALPVHGQMMCLIPSSADAAAMLGHYAAVLGHYSRT